MPRRRGRGKTGCGVPRRYEGDAMKVELWAGVAPSGWRLMTWGAVKSPT
jgi:hypothetical protein